MTAHGLGNHGRWSRALGTSTITIQDLSQSYACKISLQSGSARDDDSYFDFIIKARFCLLRQDQSRTEMTRNRLVLVSDCERGTVRH